MTAEKGAGCAAGRGRGAPGHVVPARDGGKRGRHVVVSNVRLLTVCCAACAGRPGRGGVGPRGRRGREDIAVLA